METCSFAGLACGASSTSTRCYNETPAGLAHRLTRDDSYRGYFPTKRACCLGQSLEVCPSTTPRKKKPDVGLVTARVMMRDPDLYPSPEMTKETSKLPELTIFPSNLAWRPACTPRALKDAPSNLRPSSNLLFCRLRMCRICSGLHFAENSIWIVTATILYCFEIRKAKRRIAWGPNHSRLPRIYHVGVDQLIPSTRGHPKPFEKYR
jgi:hypothetical protein